MDFCELPRWQLLKEKLDNLSPDKFREEFLKHDDAVLVDVRTEEEVRMDSLEGAVHLDYLAESFLDRLEVWDRDRTYFLYCRTGRRSVRAGVLMRNWGFARVKNLDGGLVAWKAHFENQSVLKDAE